MFCRLFAERCAEVRGRISIMHDKDTIGFLGSAAFNGI